MNININKILNDTMSSVKSTYNTAEKAITSPKKVEIIVTHKIDLSGTYGDALKAAANMTEKDMEKHYNTLNKFKKFFMKKLENELK